MILGVWDEFKKLEGDEWMEKLKGDGRKTCLHTATDGDNSRGGLK